MKKGTMSKDEAFIIAGDFMLTDEQVKFLIDAL
jgi:hypothetical protein